MKRTRLSACCLAFFCLFTLSACKSNANNAQTSASPSPTSTIAPFGTEDLTVSGFTMAKTTFDEAKQALGPEFEEDEYTLGVDKSKWKSLMNDDITYAFMEEDGRYILAHVSITGSSVAAPRETKIGDSVDSVLAKFPQTPDDAYTPDEDTALLYRANTSIQTDVCVPPCGVKTDKQISYYAPAAPYSFDLTDEAAVKAFDLSTNTNYALFYEITDGKISAIYLRYGADLDTP
ncbi:MAG: hypothetical protein ACLUR9_00750 [Christensenellales bacterium]